MHIVLLNDDILPKSLGGAAVVFDRLAKGYEQAGHKVSLVTTHQDASLGAVLKDKNTISLLSSYHLKHRHRHCLGDPAMKKKLEQAFKELKPDAVHAHNIHAHLTYQSLLVAKKFTDNIILTAHDVFLVAFYRVRGPRFERTALSGKPFRMHWWDHLLAVGRKYWPLRNRAIRKILKQSGAKVVAISEAHKKLLEANGIRVHAVVPNGTEVRPLMSEKKTSEFRKQYGLAGPTILYGGRLSDDKGSTVLLKAFARVREQCTNTQLLVTGDMERIEDELKSVSPDVRAAIVVTGWLAPAALRVAYSAATVVITPSLCFDPFNLMNIEAMAEAKPVVATSLGGAPEIIEDGKTGLIVYPRDIDAFADALLTFLLDPQKAAKMGKSGRARVERLFSVERQVGEYLKILGY